MKRGWIAVAVWAASMAGCVMDEGGPYGQADRAITGGSPEPGYPSVFALAYNGEGGCSGTCITPTVGLTAAHCVEGEPAEVLSGLFGATEIDPERTIQVTELAIAPEYASGTRDGDIALVRFAEDCPAVTPYNRQPLEPHVGDPVVMVGFGVTTENANDAGVKRSGVATLYSVTPSDVSGMGEGELATSNDPDGTCNGDSGGPTFMKLNGREYVVGVTSRGSTGPDGNDEPCGQGRSIATRADSYADFIDDFAGIDPGGDDEDGGDSDDSDSGDEGDDGDGDQDPDDAAGMAGGCQAVSSPRGVAALWLLALVWASRRRRPRT